MTPIPTTPAAPASRSAAITALVGVGSLLLFLLLPQRTLHTVDGNSFAVWAERGGGDYARHVLFPHVIRGVYLLLQPFGVSGMQAVQLASALGAAIGLAALHRAFRRLPTTRELSLLATAAVLGTPAWFFYATTGEIHGVFAAGAGLAWWAFARWHDRPDVHGAAVTGLATGFAALLHSFGHLLAPAFAVAPWVLGKRPARPWPQLAAFAAVHAVMTLVGPRLLGAGAAGQAADAVFHLEERWATFAPDTALAVLWREWLLPYTPWSWLGLLAVLLPVLRRPGLLVWLLLLLHLPLVVLLLGFHGIDESGAYLLALAPAAVAAGLPALPTRLRWLGAVMAAAVTLWLVAPNWRAPMPADFTAGLAALHRQAPIALVVGNADELAAARQVPQMVLIPLGESISAYRQTRQPGQTYASFFDLYAANLRQAGLRLVFTDDARNLLDENGDPDAHHFWRNHIATTYRLVALRELGFAGTELAPR